MDESASYRLPTVVRPQHYRLELAPDLEAATFVGTVVITLDVATVVPALVLNAAELEIDSARLLHPDGSEQDGTVELDPEEERASLAFATPVAAGAGDELVLTFRGILNDKLAGFYRSTFTDDDGHEVVIATTQFESTDARRAFPCWDEPEFKARFAVSLVVDDRLSALSNGAVMREEQAGPGRRRVTFAETMVMSTYLVAFIVGPFELTRPAEVDGVPMRVVSVPGRAHLTDFATQAAAHALQYLSRYFEIPYPGDKLDHVAVPDFAFGAMENLGCVTYRESVLLVDPAAASQLELQRIATVVAHETAHMWFGDLVTMKWWSGVWLNEAFATFMEVTTADAWKPEWELWTGFGAGKAAAFSIDGLHATRPVEFEVGRPAEAEAMFDVLTYQKGGAVLRMLEQYLGPDVFRRGISRYLKDHSYGNTVTADLWAGIEAVSGEPVGTIMGSWIAQGGYPLVTVTPGPAEGHVTLAQSRFLYDGARAHERWVVPVNLRASVDGQVVQRRLLLDGASATVDLGGTVDWVVVNEGGWGFYRVRYAPELLAPLAADLQGICTPLERMAVISDTWATVVAGAEPIETLLGLITAPSLVDHERHPDVWQAILAPLNLLDLVAPESARPALAAFVRRVAGPAFARLGWDPRPGEPPLDGVARSRLLATLGTIGADADAQAEAARRVARFDADGTGLAPDLVTAALRAYTEAGGEAAYRAVLDQYHRTVNPQEKNRYLFALASTPDPALLSETLAMCLSSDVRSQDAPFVIGDVIAHRAGAALAWAFVEDHWDQINERFPRSMIIRMIEGVAGLSEPALVSRVHAFLDRQGLSSGPRAAQLEERMDVNVALAARVGPSLAQALAGGEA